MLSRVKIQNFKSIGEPGVDLVLRPLTFLVGPNGTGKSSVLEAIAATAKRHSGRQLMDFERLDHFIHKRSELVATVELDYPNIGITGGPLCVRLTLPGENFEYLEGSELPQQSETSRCLFQSHKAKIFPLSSVRGDVPYEVGTAYMPNWVGPRGEDLLLRLALAFGPDGDVGVARNITKWASQFGIGSLTPGFSGADKVASSYVDTELDTKPNLGFASSGAKQILTIITQLFWAPEGSLLMIEEPEISLRPQAQIDVLEMFAEAINDDKQIIATTHSLFMMQAIGYAVHKGWLTADQIGVYHLEKKKNTGTVAKELPVK